MAVETADTIAELNAAWPLGTDDVSDGDNHLRLIKAVLQKDALSLAGGGRVSGVLTLTTMPFLISGNGGINYRSTIAVGTLGGWRSEISSAGHWQLTPRDANDDVLSAGGSFQLTRNPSGITDMALNGAGVSVSPPSVNSVMTRARGDARYTLATSSERYKDNILGMAPGAAVEDFRPVSFVWGGELSEDDPRRGRLGFGFIAEEVAKVLPEAVTLNGEGEPEGLEPHALLALAYAEIADLKARLAAAGIP